MNLHDFVARGVAPDQFHLAARAIQGGGEQAEQGFIGGSLYRWRRDADAQLRTGAGVDFISGRPGLQLDGQRDALGLRVDEAGQGTGDNR